MISRRTTNQGLSFLDVTTPLCTASLCLQGAHLTSWKPEGHEDCLFLSPNAAFVPGKAIRGGIPVCWPWFGPRERRAVPRHSAHFGMAPPPPGNGQARQHPAFPGFLSGRGILSRRHPAPYTGQHADHETGNHGAHAALQTHGSLPQLFCRRQPDQMPRFTGWKTSRSGKKPPSP